MKKTKEEYERYLNNFYQELGYIETFNQLEYLTNKNRKIYCTQTKISNYNNKGLAGTLLKKFDSIAFEVGYQEWRREQ